MIPPKKKPTGKRGGERTWLHRCSPQGRRHPAPALTRSGMGPAPAHGAAWGSGWGGRSWWSSTPLQGIACSSSSRERCREEGIHLKGDGAWWDGTDPAAPRLCPGEQQQPPQRVGTAALVPGPGTSLAAASPAAASIHFYRNARSEATPGHQQSQPQCACHPAARSTIPTARRARPL